MSQLLNLVVSILLLWTCAEIIYHLVVHSQVLLHRTTALVSIVAILVLIVHMSLTSTDHEKFKQPINECLGSNGDGVIGSRYLRGELKPD